jgi:hypothetical protein
MRILLPPLAASAACLLLLSSACGAPPSDRTASEEAAPEAASGTEPTASTEPAQPVAASPSAAPAAYVQELADWQAEREASLTRPGGWLTLVGLYWLHPGANTFGSDAGNDLVFPDKAPGRVGSLVLGDDGAVTLRPAERPEESEGPHLEEIYEEPSGGAETGGDDGAETVEMATPVSDPIVMVPDTEKETTEIALGSLRFWIIVRGDRVGVRLLDRESPAVDAFEGLETFPADPAWKVEARLERREGFTVPMPNVLGQVEDVPSPGVLHFRAPTGEELSLVPLGEGDSLFIVFGDRTNGHTTYGGGRFLYAEVPAADGADPRVELDFNRAYNPPCAFTEFATCPLPPRQNKLPIPVEVGEKRYAGGPAHHAPAAGE